MTGHGGRPSRAGLPLGLRLGVRSRPAAKLEGTGPDRTRETPMFTLTVCLLDPYGRGRDRLIGPTNVVDRAALAECREAGHRGRWHLGRRAACADHLQDALAADAALTRDGRL
jgi:hypothetical protein